MKDFFLYGLFGFCYFLLGLAIYPSWAAKYKRDTGSDFVNKKSWLLLWMSGCMSAYYVGFFVYALIADFPLG